MELDGNVDFRGDMLKLAGQLQSIQLSGKRVHACIKEAFLEKPGVYFCFNVPTNLPQIRLDEWMSWQKIRQLTAEYIQRTSNQFCDCLEAIIRSISDVLLSM